MRVTPAIAASLNTLELTIAFVTPFFQLGITHKVLVSSSSCTIQLIKEGFDWESKLIPAPCGKFMKVDDDRSGRSAVLAGLEFARSSPKESPFQPAV